MFIRKISLAAFVVAALAASAADVAAQARGQERAASATAQDAPAKSMAAKNPKAMPPGIQKVFGDGPFPPGIARTRPAPEPAPEPEPEPTPEPDPDPEPDNGGECIGGIWIVDGFPQGNCTAA